VLWNKFKDYFNGGELPAILREAGIANVIRYNATPLRETETE